MPSRPNILITNDDGIHAPGIRHLWSALNEFANLTIIAPAYEQSAVGMSITIRHPLRFEKVEGFADTPAWKVNGTPADCVKMALSVILDKAPDIIVSGINRGSNAGRNLLYSGTVAGVIEGIMHDIPGIAFSCYDYANPNFIDAQKYIPNVLKHIIERPLPTGTLLNVNFPPRHLGINGIKMSRQGKELLIENPNMRHHPDEGDVYYWLGFKSAIYDEEDESDIAWMNKGFIAAVPVHVHELTDHHHLKENKEHLENLFNLK